MKCSRIGIVLYVYSLLIGTVICGCSRESELKNGPLLPTSSVGRELSLLQKQVRRFEQIYPGEPIHVIPSPDSSDARRQQYAQWLHAGIAKPDILQLDVTWLSEFASARWISPIENQEGKDYITQPWAAGHYQGILFALPWFVDIPLLYAATNSTPGALSDLFLVNYSSQSFRYSYLWQAARYEGLVCSFIEVLHSMGGRWISEDDYSVHLDEKPAIEALDVMRRSFTAGVSPLKLLSWMEEHTRISFQNGEAAFMRNWPYAMRLLNDPELSRVALQYRVFPLPSATLGGSMLAINAKSEFKARSQQLIQYLTAPEQMVERFLALGQFPARVSVYGEPEVQQALPLPASEILGNIRTAIIRPRIPVYAQASAILQVWLHRALSGEITSQDALKEAASETRSLLKRFNLGQYEDDR